MKTMNIEECSSLLKISVTTACELSAKGEIPGCKIGRAWVFLEDELVAYLRIQIRDQTLGRQERAKLAQQAIEIARRPLIPRQYGRKRRVLLLPPISDLKGQ